MILQLIFVSFSEKFTCESKIMYTFLHHYLWKTKKRNEICENFFNATVVPAILQ